MISSRSSKPGRLAHVIGQGGLFHIDEFACAEAAQAIRGYKAAVEETRWGQLPKANQLTFKLAFVAICHQMNWDFLQDRLATHLLSDDETEMVQRLETVKADQVAHWLSGYKKPRRIDATKRAAMLRSVGKELQRSCHGSSLALVRESAGRIAGPTGFVSQLARFEPYREDPLQKKSYVLIQDLVRERIVAFEDEDSLRPAIDYHIMRLYLRSGRVVPVHDVVVDILKTQAKPRPRLVRLLRESVSEALHLTARLAHLPVADVNYVEWQLGRAICDPKAPHCVNTKPHSMLASDVAILFRGGCPYMGFCHAFQNPEWRKLREPRVSTTFY
ncbi:MAG: hypothetical protein K1Y01_10290 [Vicinamibacteria bacterium]|nr:hypothetical protein [Vicinamibacteria bacterium]